MSNVQIRPQILQRLLYDLKDSYTDGYYGCVDQAVALTTYLRIKQRERGLDDVWKFNVNRASFIPPHKDVKAKSGNKCDPIMTLDPWAGRASPEY
jgi:hypothetical protein